ncbi:hypothetical protein [Hyphomicrobium sp. NDB2Meth4]|uniref:hypothetical protein n=1 Tax=Hyphomicrobium sp. NDB2Meth4 TaxID=1892846 RepID=UPI000930E238|nr:hypothetical protein [Hyphomicrobium sp. NDB2Meth4]
MTQTFISERLSYGGQDTCKAHPPDQAVVHACKEPCHRSAVGYTAKSLAPAHPNYLAHRTKTDLYLNLIDPPVPLFKLESFEIALDFMHTAYKAGPLHIHCNQGQSRAPSLALLLMAKRLGHLPNSSYAEARSAFEALYPYSPGKGIARFLTDNWGGLSS